jgi:uncharacterized membrane protein YdcZ (DUF606 family)
MKKLVLPAGRPFNIRACLILLGLLVLAEIAEQPYSLTLTGTTYPGFWMLMLSVMPELLQYLTVGSIGLLLASQVGLGMPFIEGWIKREPKWNQLPGVAGIAILAGILTPLTSVLDNTLAFLIKPYAQYLAKFSTLSVINPPAWQGLMTSFSAGITEETAYRLFLLSLLAFLGNRIFRSQTGRPAPWQLWMAGILSAILFSLGHLPLARQLGIPIDAIGVIRIIIHNGVPGVVYGWLFWSFGLESAMLAHTSSDVVIKVLFPLITQQTDPTHRLIVGTIVLLALGLAVLWSIRLIRRDQKQFSTSSESGSIRMESGFS